MTAKRIIQILSFMLLIGMLAACSPDEETAAPSPTPTPGETQVEETPPGEEVPDEDVTNQAVIDSVEILLMESMPVQVTVEITGTLSNGCLFIDTVETTRAGMTFTINIITGREPQDVCTEALVPFTERVPLDVLGLEAGTYTVEVNGRSGPVTQTFDLAIDNVPVEELSETPTEAPAEEPAETPVSFELPAACIPTGEQNGPFVNLQDGYCLQYPAAQGYRVKDVLPGGIAAIWGPPLTPGFEPIRAGLTIRKDSPANGRSLDDIVAEVLVTNPEAYVADNAATFAGEPAQVVEGIPGMMDGRRYYLIHNDFLYVITLVPLTDQTEYSEQVMAQRELLWQAVSETFSWIPAELEQFDLCPPIEQGRSPYVNVPYGYCLQYPSHYRQQYNFAQNMVLFISPPVDPTIPEPLQVLLMVSTSEANGRSLEQVIADTLADLEGLDIEQSQTTIGGQPAVIMLGLPGRDAGRDLIVVHNDTVYYLRVDPLGFPEIAEDLDAAWNMVLESFTFLP
jgi:hypothetical protein